MVVGLSFGAVRPVGLTAAATGEFPAIVAGSEVDFFEPTVGPKTWEEKVSCLEDQQAIGRRYLHLAREIQDLLEGPRRELPPNWFALAVKPSQKVSETLQLLKDGGPCDLIRSLPLQALLDPRVMGVTVLRLGSLLLSKGGLAGTRQQLQEFLLKGSGAIDSQIRPVMERWLNWEHGSAGPAVDVAGVCRHLGRPQQQVLPLMQEGCALEEAIASPEDVAAAAACLYHRASRERGPVAHQDVEQANRLLLFLEQRQVLQPLYDARPELRESMRVLTPFMQLPPIWNFYDYAVGLGDRDGNCWTSPVTEQDWSSWPDRWAAIEDYGQRCQQNPGLFWRSLGQ